MTQKHKFLNRLWKGAALLLLIPSLALIPGIPHPLIHAFLWFTPIPTRVELPALEDGPERILIIAPHPDDEVLAVGGTIAQLVKEGHLVLVTFLTNGEANRATKRLLTFSPLHRATDYRALGYRRQKEAVRALGVLGVGPEQLIFLGYPDQGLMALWTNHWESDDPYRSPYTKTTYPFYSNSYNSLAVYSGADLLSILVDIVRHFRPTVVYIPHQEDLHLDHRAGFFFGMATLSSIDPEYSPDIRLYLVHAVGWPYPRQLVPAMVLDPPDSPEDWAWQSFELSENVVKMKLAALRTYSSQWWTNSRFLATFVRPNEIYSLPLNSSPEWNLRSSP